MAERGYTYSYTKARYNRALLTEITTAGLPTATMDGRGDQLQLRFAEALRASELLVLDAVVAAHVAAVTIFEQARIDWLAAWNGV